MNWLEKEFDFQAGAILNFNKPTGKSSFWIVKQVRNLIGAKVGHAGTLDPFAEGVLLLCTGKATKQVSKFMDMPKEYVGEIELGTVTNTDDCTGEIVKEQEIPDLDIKIIRETLHDFVGDIYQTPPMFSAKKVQGKRLYKIARTGKVIERKPSFVHLEDIQILSFEIPIIKIKVICSKGTYIRALARDVGEKLGCGGHLKSLIRTKIGKYKIEDSLSLEQFRQIYENF